MKKMLKEIFSSKNLMKAMLLVSLTDSSNLTSDEYLNLVKSIRGEENVTNKEIELKKAS